MTAPAPITVDVRQHVYALLFHDMNLCCGSPEASYDLVRDLLAAAHREERAQTLIPHDGARYIVLAVLDRAGLIEHGTVIDRSWLTPKGRWCLEAMSRMTYDDVEDSDGGPGLPHDGKPCTPRCFKVFWPAVKDRA